MAEWFRRQPAKLITGVQFPLPPLIEEGMKMKRSIAAGLVVLGLLAACADPPRVEPGGPADTGISSEGEWRHITRFQGNSIDMTCTKNGTGIYVIAGYHGLAVVDNDPSCK
jgi:hypothetical protein